jgi:hypothetical protein
VDNPAFLLNSSPGTPIAPVTWQANHQTPMDQSIPKPTT